MPEKYELTYAEIWTATSYEPNDKESLTLQDGQRVAQAAQKKLLKYQDKYMGGCLRRLADFDLTNSSPALLVAGIDELRKIWQFLLKDFGL